MHIPDASIRLGFARVKWPGRFEVLQRDPPVVIDSAHNRDSALRLRQTIETYFPGWPVVLVFCALEDKDVEGILTELRPVVTQVVATRADHPRAPAAEWILEQVRAAGLPAQAVVPGSLALDRAIQLAGNGGLVLVAGSVAFAGEMRRSWLDRTRRAAQPERAPNSGR
jgi:dihydrofolate synthase/folylpolyglutamate synthase